MFWTAAIKLLAHNLEKSRIVLTPALAHAALATKVGANSLAKHRRAPACSRDLHQSARPANAIAPRGGRHLQDGSCWNNT